MEKFLCSSEAAKKLNFATFNGFDHLCVDMDEKPLTISVRTADDQHITFSFINRPSGPGSQCVDIVHHDGPKNESGNPLQTASFLGQGPTNFVTRPSDKSPTTIVSVSLKRN